MPLPLTVRTAVEGGGRDLDRAWAQCRAPLRVVHRLLSTTLLEA
jgi:hypothetical protein